LFKNGDSIGKYLVFTLYKIMFKIVEYIIELYYEQKQRNDIYKTSFTVEDSRLYSH